jgi:hypothetical protein
VCLYEWNLIVATLHSSPRAGAMFSQPFFGVTVINESHNEKRSRAG